MLNQQKCVTVIDTISDSELIFTGSENIFMKNLQFLLIKHKFLKSKALEGHSIASR